VNAQYVTIADTAFVNWLTTNYPTCMNGNQMDTTCSGIVNEVSVNVNNLMQLNSNIINLSGIQYFDNLDSLNCGSNNFLNNIPSLPSHLKFLLCSSNQLTSLPTLPSTLTYLNYSGNQVNSSPTLPNSLIIVDCHDNPISTLPTLPNNLEVLDCSQNNLTTLPTLPSSLYSLTCYYNQLTTLPQLPNNLLLCICWGNQLTSLPILPNNLQNLQCFDNNISCLPQLPNNINIFSISNNPINCLPNYIAAMDATALAMPLCATNDFIYNPNNCAGSTGILGKVYQDNNSNCSFDVSDSAIHNIQVKFYNPITNVFGAAYTTTNGVYNYVCNTGTNFVLVDTLNKPYKANCQHPGIDSTVVTTTANSLAQNVNFDIECKNGYDVGVQSITHTGLVFPGQTHTLQVIAGDASQWYGLNCSAGTSGQVSITVDGPVTFAGVPSGALTPSISGNIYTYSITDFSAINNQTAFKLLLITNTTAQSGNTVCVNVNIATISSDNNTINNNSYLCYNVVNSYDPNYKEVYPNDVLPGYADWFTYTVHFQNLGTAAAININVLDTLDSNLDEETFEVINYSHYNETVLQNHIVNFRFPNIQLPDSANNPVGSIGYIQYRIKPKANMPLGTQIKNTAHIYFDYNPAIVTNTTVNNFTTITSLNKLQQTSRLWCYPNPANDKLFVESSKLLVQSSKLSIIDVLGNEVMTQTITNEKTELKIQNLPKGIYFVKCGNETLKFIKQ
jgi:uncharacterized repeat protein (TIGR01451 family)